MTPVSPRGQSLCGGGCVHQEVQRPRRAGGRVRGGGGGEPLRGDQELASDPRALAATLSGSHKPPVGPGGRAGPGRGVRTPARQCPCRPAKRVSPGGFCSPPSRDLSFARPPLTAGWMSVRFLAVFGSCFCFVLGAHVTGAKGVGGHCPCWCPHQADRRSPRGGPGRQHFWVLPSPDCTGRTHACRTRVGGAAPQAGEGLGPRPVVSRVGQPRLRPARAKVPGAALRASVSSSAHGDPAWPPPPAALRAWGSLCFTPPACGSCDGVLLPLKLG